jgi:hypothetical protein
MILVDIAVTNGCDDVANVPWPIVPADLDACFLYQILGEILVVNKRKSIPKTSVQ